MDLDPDWSNFVDPDPDTINPDPHHWFPEDQLRIRKMVKTIPMTYWDKAYDLSYLSY